VDIAQIRDDMARPGVDPELDMLSRMREAELNAEDDELDDAGCSGDEYSIFGQSGVESECDEAQSQPGDDKLDDEAQFKVCLMCDKRCD